MWLTGKDKGAVTTPPPKNLWKNLDRDHRVCGGRSLTLFSVLFFHPQNSMSKPLFALRRKQRCYTQGYPGMHTGQTAAGGGGG